MIGWAISNRMIQDLAIRALNRAIAFRRLFPCYTHHTDRASQYCAHHERSILRRQRFRVSMSGTSNCHDKSAVESFFKALRADWVWRHDWQTRRDAEIALCERINGL